MMVRPSDLSLTKYETPNTKYETPNTKHETPNTIRGLPARGNVNMEVDYRSVSQSAEGTGPSLLLPDARRTSGTIRKVLMACTNYWTSPFQVGSHHLARAFLQRGWQVGFISEPISPWHFLKGVSGDLRDRLAIYRQGGQWRHGGNLWSYVPGTLLTPHNQPVLRSDWVYRNWARFTLPDVRSLAAVNGFGDVDLLYIDSVYQPFWLDSLRYKKAVLRIADYNPGYAKYTPAARRGEEQLAQAVDLVVYASRTLRPHIESLRPRQMLHLPNGVDFRHFADHDRPVPDAYTDIPKPIVVYAGSCDVRFDQHLFRFAARELPDVSFVLIGSTDRANAKLAALPNVHALGTRPHGELPPYLHHADLGIIPFDVEGHPQLVHAVHPLKLYEYFACGLPVVAVDWAELRRLRTPARLCQGHENFVRAIAETLAHPKDKVEGMRFAAAHDWGTRLEALLQALDLAD
jgi:glycosyltransferase involved in cell wall biosynthesis